MRRFAFIILLLVSGCGEMRETGKQTTIDTPGGEIVMTESPVDSSPQTISPVSSDELQRLRLLAAKGPDFVRTYIPEVPEPQLVDYDRAFRAWQTSSERRHSQQEVIDILGAYLGNKCVADFDMEWVIVSDEVGVDHAIRHKSVEVIAYPFSTMLKRIEDNEYDFLYAVYHAVEHTIKSGEAGARHDAKLNK